MPTFSSTTTSTAPRTNLFAVSNRLRTRTTYTHAAALNLLAMTPVDTAISSEDSDDDGFGSGTATPRQAAPAYTAFDTFSSAGAGPSSSSHTVTTTTTTTTTTTNTTSGIWTLFNRKSRKGKDREVRTISTVRGQGFGETETSEMDSDAPSSRFTSFRGRGHGRLPTSRAFPPSPPLIPPPAVELGRVGVVPIEVLYAVATWGTVLPGTLGALWALFSVWSPPAPMSNSSHSPVPDRGDYIVTFLWALLTAHLCLSATTGLQVRWRLYYTPLSTLIRLISLQALTWPLTYWTLNFFGGRARPVLTWALIATTTACSKAAQIWVVSNIRFTSAPENGHGGSVGGDVGGGSFNHVRAKSKSKSTSNLASLTLSSNGSPQPFAPIPIHSSQPFYRTKRHLDMHQVLRKAVLPVVTVYFIMAWVGEGRRQLYGCAAGC